MAASPSNIVRRCSLKASENDGQVSERYIIRMFLNSGYGPVKAKRWIDTYVANNILTVVGYDDDNGNVYSCGWWIA